MNYFFPRTETFHYIYLLINSSNWRWLQLGIGSLKNCWEVWAESWLQKVLRLVKKMPSSCNIQYIPLHVSSMEEELEETPDKRKGWCHEKIPLRHVSVKKL